ncbi:hypothetical protein [Amycolatopsis sp. NPDC059657]|uniref:hypothetical protein n=1 Tax=Amycolatopsis sp. NPDC059657 TaxID=3346899 RepID=UPI00366DDAA1
MNDYHYTAVAEPALWKPGVDADRLRWRAVRWRVLGDVLWPGPFVAVFVGGGAVALADAVLMVVLGWVLIAAGIAFAGVSFFWEKGERLWLRDADWLLGQRDDKLFYTVADVAGFPAAVVLAVRQIIVATDKLRHHEGAAWLGTEQLDHVHRLAWEAVSSVDETREARRVVRDARGVADLAGAVRAVEANVAARDRDIERAADCLRQVLVLADAWTEKLRAVTMRAALETWLEQLVLPSISPLVTAMEGIPEAVFAYILAARDLLDAGPFPWERTGEEWRRAC